MRNCSPARTRLQDSKRALIRRDQQGFTIAQFPLRSDRTGASELVAVLYCNVDHVDEDGDDQSQSNSQAIAIVGAQPVYRTKT